MTFRVLHIDDEPDIRRVVQLALCRDADVTLRSCATSQEGIAAAQEWLPHLILCDVMMPIMDGPTTLARLRSNPRTAAIPVVFMTARAQAGELDHFKSLGASGVITKPFSASGLVRSVRAHLAGVEAQQECGQIDAADLRMEREAFHRRMQADATVLARLRGALAGRVDLSGTLDELESLAHKLSGAAGCFGFAEVGTAAIALEHAVTERRRDGVARIEAEADVLAGLLERELTASNQHPTAAGGLRETQR